MAIVAHTHRRFRIIDLMRDSTDDRSDPDPNGAGVVPAPLR